MVLGYRGINHFENYSSLNTDILKQEIIEKYKSDIVEQQEDMLNKLLVFMIKIVRINL